MKATARLCLFAPHCASAGWKHAPCGLRLGRTCRHANTSKGIPHRRLHGSVVDSRLAPANVGRARGGSRSRGDNSDERCDAGAPWAWRIPRCGNFRQRDLM